MNVVIITNACMPVDHVSYCIIISDIFYFYEDLHNSICMYVTCTSYFQHCLYHHYHVHKSRIIIDNLILANLTLRVHKV